MKNILLFVCIILAVGNNVTACTCGFPSWAPNTFCGTLNTGIGNLGGGPPGYIVKAVKLQDINHGMSALILANLKGVISEDTITLWGDPGNLCRTYTGFLNIGDTLILGINPIGLSGANTMELPEHYYFPGCGLYYLNIYNDTVYGQISADSNAMELSEFENYIVNNIYQTSCVPVYVGTDIKTKETLDLRITPNPFSNRTTVKILNSKLETLTLLIYDLQGRVVRTISNITSDEVVVEKGNLSTGLYLLKFTGKSGLSSSGKLVVN